MFHGGYNKNEDFVGYKGICVVARIASAIIVYLLQDSEQEIPSEPSQYLINGTGSSEQSRVIAAKSHYPEDRKHS